MKSLPEEPQAATERTGKFEAGAREPGEDVPGEMNILRLAYITLFLIALFTVFTLWGQVGGQGHLDLVPWHVKLVLATAAAFAIMRAAAAAVAGDRGWNAQSVKWLGLALATLVLCGMASYYAHVNFEDTGNEDDSGDATISSLEINKTGMPIRV